MSYPDRASQPIKPEIEENYALVYGAELHYLQAGDGPLVLLLHGLVDTACQWRSVVEQLSPHFCVIALDQVGFGYSDKPLLNYKIQTLVDFLDCFCQTLEIQSVALVGAGIGAAVAAAFAGQHSIVHRLALINPHLTVDDLTCSGLLELQPLATCKQTQHLLQCLFHNPEAVVNQQMIDQQLTQQVLMNDGYTKQTLMQAMAKDENLESALDQLALPTLLVYGQSDPLSTRRDRLLSQIPAAQPRVIDRCGQLPQIEQPSALSEVLRQFFQS